MSQCDELSRAIIEMTRLCMETASLPEEDTCLATSSVHDGFEVRQTLCHELMQSSELGSALTALCFKSVLHHCQCALLMLIETEFAFNGREWLHSSLTRGSLDPPMQTAVLQSIRGSFQQALDAGYVRSRAYQMDQRKQRACLDAYREILLSSLGQFSEDLGVWTFLLSAHVSVKADVRMQSSARPSGTPAVVSQLAALRAPRPSIQLPLLAEASDVHFVTPRALALVFPESLNGPPPFQAGDLLVDLLPKFLLLLHDKEDLSELHMVMSTSTLSRRLLVLLASNILSLSHILCHTCIHDVGTQSHEKPAD